MSNANGSGDRNFANRTLFINDNLPVLRGLNSATVDLIYLDPPFNSQRKYAAPTETPAEGQMFDDHWKWTELDVRWLGEIDRRNPALSAVVNAARLTQGDGTAAYLTMMGIRLLEMHRILKPTGSIYLHCDPTASHYLKASMDAVFGNVAYRNEITWKRHTSIAKGSQHAPKTWGNNTDILLFYAKSHAKLHPYRPMTTKEIGEQFPLKDEHGKHYYNDSSHIWSSPNMGARPNLCYEWSPPADMWEVQHPGKARPVFRNPHASGWRLSKDRMDEEYRKGNFVVKENGKLERRKYIHDFKGKQVGNLWDDIDPAIAKERTGWATQKPLALLQRVIKASSNPGDIVLDPFAGCATCCVAAEMEGRQWLGIEACENANEIIQLRLDEADMGILGTQTNASDKVTIERNIPRRTDAEGIALAKRRRTKAYKTEANFDFLYGKQRGDCPGCTKHFQSEDMTFDHITPQAKDGSHELDNLQLLCGPCNSIKGDDTMEDLKRRLKKREEQKLAKLERMGLGK